MSNFEAQVPIAPLVDNNIGTAAFRSDDSKSLVLLSLLFHLALSDFFSFRFAHRAFAAFAARAFAWGVPATALPPLAPIRLRYSLMDSSTVVWFPYHRIGPINPTHLRKSKMNTCTLNR